MSLEGLMFGLLAWAAFLACSGASLYLYLILYDLWKDGP